MSSLDRQLVFERTWVRLAPVFAVAGALAAVVFANPSIGLVAAMSGFAALVALLPAAVVGWWAVR